MPAAVFRNRLDVEPVALTVSGSRLINGQGQTVRLRGVNTEGVANFSTFYSGGMAAYIDRLVAKDANDQLWRPTIIRLNFERYPCANPARLYQAGDPRIPLCIPDTAQFPAWPANTQIVEGSVYTYGGYRYAASRRVWRADKGAAWNAEDHTTYVVGDVVCSIWTSVEGSTSANRVYVCTVAQPAYVPSPSGDAPYGTGTVTDCLGATWQYVGEWGLTGSSQPFGGTRVFDGNHGAGVIYFDGWIDHTCSWQRVGSDFTEEEAEAAWDDWTADVLNPTVQRCIDHGLYCFICDFDFGPANLPLRNARMMDFWDRVSQGVWKNHPRVMFDLWNESETVGTFDGWTWSLQKADIQACVDLIRANGATNVILCTTPAYCALTYQATADPLTGSNIMYACHLYSDYYADTDNDTNLSTALATGQAVFVSEFGANQPDDTGIVNAFIADLMGRIEPTYGSSHPAAGWAAWSASQYWAPAFFTDSAYSMPNYYGTVIRGLLAGLN